MSSTPPSNISAERHLLASVMIRPDLLPELREKISSLDFYRESHKLIFEAMAQGATNPVHIGDVLSRKGEMERAGGIAYLGEIINSASTAAGWQASAEIVKRLSLIRQWMTLGRRLLDVCQTSDADPYEISSEAKACIRDIEAELESGYMDMHRVVDDAMSEISERKSGKGSAITTGLYNLDEIFSGYERGTTNYVIARPAIGKTAFSLKVARNIAETEPGDVLFFSLEMTYRALARRLLSTESQLHLSKLKSGNIYTGEAEQLDTAAKSLSESRIIIVDHPKYREIEKLIAATESLATQKKLSCVIIDHIQKTTSRKKFNSTNSLYEYISGEMSALAKSVNVPFIILSQLSRASESRAEHERRPKLEDMRSSGAWEQDADTVIGLHRSSRDSRILQVQGLKDRDGGGAGKIVFFDFDGATQNIVDTTRERAKVILESEKVDIKNNRGFA